jgi:hypothetical protein
MRFLPRTAGFIFDLRLLSKKYVNNDVKFYNEKLKLKNGATSNTIIGGVTDDNCACLAIFTIW